jgi:hypothetical protein
VKRFVPVAALLIGVVAAAVAVIAPAFAGDGPLSPELQQVRAAVARYHSLNQALNDGYVLNAGEACVASPPAPTLDGSRGTMGIHVANPALLGDPAIDPLRPELLLYVPDEQGKLKLVGVEYWKADADQNLATSGDRPSLFGHPFQGPMPGHTLTMPIHYDLHAWVAEANPNGEFAQFNSAISC